VDKQTGQLRAIKAVSSIFNILHTGDLVHFLKPDYRALAGDSVTSGPFFEIANMRMEKNVDLDIEELVMTVT